jgi:hypothetical protein
MTKENTYLVTGTFNGSHIGASSEGQARRMFHNHYSGESIIHLEVIYHKNGQILIKNLQKGYEHE